jgi:hypothetical protein
MLVALACSVCVAQSSVPATPQAESSKPAPKQPSARFGAAVLVLAGSEPMGVDRLYPSPVLHDLNGDGRLDVVLGDLWGKLTLAPRLDGDGPAWGADSPIRSRDGEELDFSNW